MIGDLWALYAGRLLAGLASGAAFATDSANRGRMRCPAGKTACARACPSSGGAEGPIARPNAH